MVWLLIVDAREIYFNFFWFVPFSVSVRHPTFHKCWLYRYTYTQTFSITCYTAVFIWWKNRCASSGQWLRGQSSICHSLVVLRRLKHGFMLSFFRPRDDDERIEEWRMFSKGKKTICAAHKKQTIIKVQTTRDAVIKAIKRLIIADQLIPIRPQWDK